MEFGKARMLSDLENRLQKLETVTHIQCAHLIDVQMPRVHV